MSEISYHSGDFDWDSFSRNVESNFYLDGEDTPMLESIELTTSCDGEAWDTFYSRHHSASFFKERRYLTAEFPELLQTHQHKKLNVLEVGCGSGSTLLPILKANSCSYVVGLDVSNTAVAQCASTIAKELKVEDAERRVRLTTCNLVDEDLRSILEKEGIVEWLKRASSSTIDSSSSTHSPVSGEEEWQGFDVITMIFCLSAIHPVHMPQVLRGLSSVLRPGGKILFRDYGLYDMAMLRFPARQRISRLLYRRLDGTLAFFFSKEFVSELFEEAGFQQEESDYCCVRLLNRKKNRHMARVWLHAKFSKCSPAAVTCHSPR